MRGPARGPFYGLGPERKIMDRIAFEEVEEFFEDMQPDIASGAYIAPREDFEDEDAHEFFCDLCQDYGMASHR